MNELKIIIKAVTADAQKNMQAVKKELQGISAEAKSTSDKFGTAMKGIAKATVIAITAVTAVITAIVALGKSTLDFQKQTAQLNAAFGAMGKSAAEAADVYKNFYRFLGDSDTAVEASNLLIKLTQDEKNLTQWTKILQGVYATFPDSLPIEGLVESANETARVGVVTGNLADALNWAGANEDVFNEKLAQTTSLEEREALIRSTLNGLYGRAAEIYEQNNQALLEYNESQANLQQASAALGATITPLLTYLNNLGAAIMTVLKPAFETVLPYIAGFVLWLTEAISRAAIFSSMLSGTSETIKDAGNAMTGSFSGANNTLEETKKEIDAIKKATMGFDELNVVPSGQTSTGSTGNSGAAGGGSVPNFEGLTNVAGSLEDFKKKTEAVKESIDQWMEDWSWALQGIAAILAALSVRHLILQFGELIGCAEAFKSALSFTGILAGITKFAGWLGAVIALVKEGNSLWSVLGVAFPKIASVITAVGGAFTKVGAAIGGAAKAAAAFIGGLAGWQIALIIAAIAALASGIVFLAKNWDEVTAKVKEFCKLNLVPILEEFKTSFAALWGAIQELGAAFVNLGVTIWDALPEGLQDWLYNVWQGIKNVVAAIVEWVKSVDWLGVIGTAIEGLGAIIVGILGGVIAGAIQAVLNLVESAVQIITGAIQMISGILSLFVNFIVAIFTGDFSKCKDSVELIWEGIKNVFKGACDAVIGTVWGFIEGIIDFFVHMWDVLVGHSIVPDTIEAIIEWFAYLPVRVFELVAGFVRGVIDFFADLAVKIGEWAVTIWSNIKKPFTGVGNWFKDRWGDVKNALSNVGSWFSTTFSTAYTNTTNAFKNAKTGFANVWSNIKAGFGNVSDWFKNTFTQAWTAVKNVFSSGGKIFDGIKDGILSGLKAVINALIGGINKVIKVPFDGINSALSSIRSVEIVGIKPFSWISTISVPQIPKLARGGIVDEATLALIGERGKEAVVPLENNTEWIDKLVEKLTARSGGPEKIVLMLDGRELGWANIKSINNITRQTGALQLTLA